MRSTLMVAGIGLAVALALTLTGRPEPTPREDFDLPVPVEPEADERPYRNVLKAAATCDPQAIAQAWGTVPEHVPASELTAASEAHAAAEACRQRALEELPRRARVDVERGQREFEQKARELFAASLGQPGMYVRAKGFENRTLRIYGDQVTELTARVLISDRELLRQFENYGFARIEFSYGSFFDPTPAYTLNPKETVIEQKDVDEIVQTMIDAYGLADPFVPPSTEP